MVFHALCHRETVEKGETATLFTLVCGPFLGDAPAARRGFLDFRGNRLVWFS